MASRFSARLARRVMAGVAVAAVSFMAACGDGGTESKGDVYTLVSVDGNPLPYDDGFGDITKSGSVSLLAGNKFSFKLNGAYSDPDLGSFNYTESATGTYTLDASSGVITFTATRACYSEAGQSECQPIDPPISLDGTKDGNTIRYVDPDFGAEFVFQKN